MSNVFPIYCGACGGDTTVPRYPDDPPFDTEIIAALCVLVLRHDLDWHSDALVGA